MITSDAQREVLRQRYDDTENCRKILRAGMMICKSTQENHHRRENELWHLEKIRTEGDPVLTKVSRPVTEMTPKLRTLIFDMLDTMYEEMGVGLAAPQVGILKRVVTIDVGDGPMVLINPEILETSGEQTGDEGCLSVPGMAGQVTRPNYVKVKALDENMEEVVYEGTELLARAFCHEIDHLDGKMYTELVEGELHRTVYDDDEV